MEKLLLSEKQDTHCLSLMNELCRAYKNIGKTDSAKNYANKIISLAEQLSSKKYKSIGLQNLGLIHYENGEYEKAIRVYLDALKIKEETKDTTGIAFVLNNIGLVYQAQNKLKDALDYYQKSKSIIEQSENKNYESLRGLSNTYNNIGLINYYQYHFDTAIVCLQKGLELRQEINDQQKIAESYTNIGNVYFMNKEYRKAIQYYSESLNMVEKLGNKRNIAFLNLNLSELYDSIGNFSEGFRLLDTALALSQEINAKELMKECYARLASMYSQKEDYKNAYEFHKKYSDIKDTILNEESSKQIAEMQTKYETEKKEQQITLLNKDKELQDAQLNRQKIIIWSVAGGLLVVLILSVFIFRERRKSEKLLLNILPVETARELKVNGKATARHYESVTVMFTDFKGFTTIAEKLSAEELVSELDFLFKKFDEIISKYNIEKIKTIG
ncbi:MAG: tetratricopeptide repeat protein, partial [Bacteroidetes bacterium]|nr:tetratricopeptide repeat protein [Bacteroidota bacterium]